MNTRLVLSKLIDRLGREDIDYVVGGGTGLMIQGVDVEDDGEIDIVTSAENAKMIENRLIKNVIKKLSYQESDNFKAHIGLYEIDGVKIEVMGDPLAKMKSGDWVGVPEKNIHEIGFSGQKVCVFTLESEYEYYSKRSAKRQRNQQIAKKILEKLK